MFSDRTDDTGSMIIECNESEMEILFPAMGIQSLYTHAEIG